jgi:hypothetical protein
MPHSSESIRKSILLFIALVCALPLIAEKPHETNRPKYDLSTESKMKATVQEVKLPAKGSEKEIAHLLVRVGTDTFDVYLCPKVFLDDMGVNFSPGEEILLTGSRIKLNSFSPVKWSGVTIPSFCETRKATPSGADIASNLSALADARKWWTSSAVIHRSGYYHVRAADGAIGWVLAKLLPDSVRIAVVRM